MLRKEIVYNNLIVILQLLTDDQVTIPFFSILDSSRQQDFTATVDELKIEIANLQHCYTKEIFYDYSSLKLLLQNTKVKFPSYINESINEISLIILISEYLSQILSDLSDTTVCPVGNFNLVCLDSVVSTPPVNYYSYTNLAAISDSLIFFSFKNFTLLQDDLLKSSNNVLLLFILLSKIGDSFNRLTEVNYILIKNGISHNLNKIKAALYLHLVYDGKTIHTAQTYISTPNIIWKDQIDIENKYQQFLDTIYILSEYNSVDDVIGKYLRLYQIVEDFMYKALLVELEQKNNGNIFSMRDFKRMNKKVSDTELPTLQKFIENIFKLLYSANITFQQHIISQFAHLATITPPQQIEQVLGLFDITTTYSDAKKDIKQVYPKLIYYVRNSIVHNKTTEYHLTYSTITPDVTSLLKDFLIPTLENCVYFLTILKSNKIVRYNNASLKLYDE